MAHAFYAAGDPEEGIAAALRYAERELGLSAARANPDIIIERHGLFSVSDARRIGAKAELAPVAGDRKLIVVAVNRIFHEAQNAMLKLFEEPPAGTTLVLVLPSEGDLLYTLRSRLSPLPSGRSAAPSEEARAFAAGSHAAREKLVARLLDDAKSDADEKKQEARAAALRLAEGLSRIAHAAWREAPTGELEAFLRDLDRLIPVLHDRAAPLKPVLEHILLVAPAKLGA